MDTANPDDEDSSSTEESEDEYSSSQASQASQASQNDLTASNVFSENGMTISQTIEDTVYVDDFGEEHTNEELDSLAFEEESSQGEIHEEILEEILEERYDTDDRKEQEEKQEVNWSGAYQEHLQEIIVTDYSQLPRDVLEMMATMSDERVDSDDHVDEQTEEEARNYLDDMLANLGTQQQTDSVEDDGGTLDRLFGRDSGRDSRMDNREIQQQLEAFRRIDSILSTSNLVSRNDLGLPPLDPLTSLTSLTSLGTVASTALATSALSSMPAAMLSPMLRINTSVPFRRSRMSAGRRPRSFHRGDTASVVRNNYTFTDADYELVYNYFNSLIWEEDDSTLFVDPHVNILNVMLEYWQDHNRHRLPDLDEIIERCINEAPSLDQLPIDDIRDMFRHYLLEDGSLPSPGDYYYIQEYLVLHDEYPNEDQLQEMRIRAMRFMVDPERFHAEDKMIVPTLHISRLPRAKNAEKDLVCCICQDEITVGQETITLVPCGHKFHANDKECLEEGSILNWLSTNNRCPMCKKKVDP